MTVSVEIIFDSRVFLLDSIKKATYRYIDKFSADISLSEFQITCHLNFSSSYTSAAAEHVVDDFKKEVLDQDLRKTIALETSGVRNLILAHAFSRTSLVQPDG